MYTIKRAAELTGISISTLRAWERRYAVVRPQRTESGYRMYDASALETLTAMNQLVHEGWPPSQAAAETLRRAAGGHGRARRGAGGHPDAGGSPTGEGPPTQPDRPDQPERRGTAGGGGPGIDALARAASALDESAVATVLDDAFSVASFERVADRWLMPALAVLGDAWSHGHVSVAGEHMATCAVQRRLAAAYEAAAHGRQGRPVIIGLPQGSRHELGLLAFAVAARRAGLPTIYLGADVPKDEWSGVVSAHEARCVVLAVPTQQDVTAARDVVTRLGSGHPGLLIAVGGAAQDKSPRDCIRLGHEIGPAAARLAALMAPPQTG